MYIYLQQHYFFIACAYCSKFEFSLTHVAYSAFLHLFYIYIYKVKLVTVVVGDPKAPFSIATTMRCRGGCYSFPWIPPLYP